MKNLLKILVVFLLGTQISYADKIPVTASFSILGDFVEQIGGERVSVTTIIGPNQDTHIYQVTPNDIKKIQNSKLFVVNGLGFEGASFNRAITQTKVKTVVATTGIKPIEIDDEHDEHAHGHENGHEHENEEYDPHTFSSPFLAQVYVRNIAEALIEIDPEGKDYYTLQLNNYLVRLNFLDLTAIHFFSIMPPEKRKVLTAHHAFAYFGDRYNIEYIAPQGTSTDAEASAKMVASIIKQVNQENIKAIFSENIKDARLVNQISKETNANVYGKLYADALDEKGTEAGSYIDMMYFNITQLAKAMH